MPSKTILAAPAVLAALLVAAPAASAATTTVCPPGVKDATYCSTHNDSGVELKLEPSHSLEIKNSFLFVKFTCTLVAGCQGEIVIENPAGKTSSSAHIAAANVVYGTGKYSLKYKESAEVKVTLTAAGKKAIANTGKLSATVAAVTNGVRSVVGHITVKGHKAKHKKHRRHHRKHHTHATHTSGRPGFTG